MYPEFGCRRSTSQSQAGIMRGILHSRYETMTISRRRYISLAPLAAVHGRKFIALDGCASTTTAKITFRSMGKYILTWRLIQSGRTNLHCRQHRLQMLLRSSVSHYGCAKPPDLDSWRRHSRWLVQVVQQAPMPWVHGEPKDWSEFF